MKVVARGLVALAMCAASSAFVLAPSPVSIERSRPAAVSLSKRGTRGKARRWLLWALRHTPFGLPCIFRSFTPSATTLALTVFFCQRRINPMVALSLPGLCRKIKLKPAVYGVPGVLVLCTRFARTHSDMCLRCRRNLSSVSCLVLCFLCLVCSSSGAFSRAICYSQRTVSLLPSSAVGRLAAVHFLLVLSLSRRNRLQQAAFLETR